MPAIMDVDDHHAARLGLLLAVVAAALAGPKSTDAPRSKLGPTVRPVSGKVEPKKQVAEKAQAATRHKIGTHTETMAAEAENGLRTKNK
jgi:hypothetical protein